MALCSAGSSGELNGRVQKKLEAGREGRAGNTFSAPRPPV